MFDPLGVALIGGCLLFWGIFAIFIIGWSIAGRHQWEHEADSDEEDEE